MSNAIETKSPSFDQLWASLTPRERQVAMAIAYGVDPHKWVEDNQISIKTFDTHRMHVMKKLGIPRGASNVRLTRLLIANRVVSATGVVAEA